MLFSARTKVRGKCWLLRSGSDEPFLGLLGTNSQHRDARTGWVHPCAPSAGARMRDWVIPSEP